MSTTANGRLGSARELPLWLLPALLLLIVRLGHLAGPIDDPHSWRQCDTANYSLDFYRHGTDLLNPAVCWLGPHRTLILEFPLPEAISAGLYRWFGPDPMWDRVVSLAFFLVAVGYFHACVAAIAPRRVARLATLAYLALPLGQFYSRAAHVDFAAIAAAHGLLYHAIRTAARAPRAHAAAAAVWGVAGALIKAPYLLPVMGPLVLVLLAVPSLGFWVSTAFAGVCTATAFVVWRRHVDAVNGAAPDWYFLPGYYKESNALWWYVGTWAQRFETAAWVRLARRLVFEVATPLGGVLGLWGLVWRRSTPRLIPRLGPYTAPGPLAFALAWLAATVGYLLVFMPLNVIHNYYQLPFMGPAALLIGLGGDAAWRALPRPAGVPAGAMAFALFLGLALVAVGPLGYYRVDWLRVEAGHALEAAVPRGDLVVVADHNSGYSDPRLLVRADRAGWPLAVSDLTPARLETLAGLGARWLAVVTDPADPGLRPPEFLRPALITAVPLAHAGTPLGRLEVFRLGAPPERLAAAP